MENTETTEATETTNRVQIAAKVTPIIRTAIENLAKHDDRSVSNTIERIFKANPDVQIEIAKIETNGN